MHFDTLNQNKEKIIGKTTLLQINKLFYLNRVKERLNKIIRKQFIKNISILVKRSMTNLRSVTE